MDKSLASRCRELLQFLSTTKGDLANVTGPPSMLAPLSVVEVGRCWAQRPAVFSAAAFETEADRRCLAVLRMVLIALRTQLYIGGSPTTSIKKPLNAFLGEMFLAEWEQPPHTPKRGHASNVSNASNASGASCTSSCGDNLSRSTTTSTAPSVLSTSSSSHHAKANTQAKTRLVAEQVSHHPPITAMHIADEANGVRADGYARVEMTFNGAVNVRQVGHAIMRIDAYDEEYLIPLPAIKVRGFLSGRLYPEITDVYHIVGTSGYSAEIKFSGQGVAWGGKRNAFVAKVFNRQKQVVFTVDGVWSQGWTVTDKSGKVIETYDVDAPENDAAPISLPPIDKQDPWESRRAWAGVLEGLETGNLGQTVAEKTKIEQAQRRMRAREAADGDTWTPLLFASDSAASTAAAETFRRLSKAVPTSGGAGLELHDGRTKGVWRVVDAKAKNIQRPLRGSTTPLGV
ncbi:oxysterol-binding protein [Ophiostoma piceae UAMH 11346]|uniref:Oxysterol-binding protein n=1 Tax=Ophiostoma piceae (strain UAMH 11346) TaxID=1262450 RepID=S3CVZ2_OPHP1|nr:oxysterol-binding protein [Ophiostoma piceae UAMH 11346]